MRCNHFAAVLAGLVAIALLAADAAAMYHPTLGRFLQRDPIGYVDGMGMYESVRSSPLVLLDPTGMQFAVPRGTDEIARERAERRRQDALRWLGTVGSNEYYFTDVTGLAAFCRELTPIANSVSWGSPGLLEWILGARGSYGLGTVYVFPDDPEATFHEIVHAYDDENDLYSVGMGHLTQQMESEALAYITSRLMMAATGFRRVENAIAEKRKCGEIQALWAEAWGGVMDAVRVELRTSIGSHRPATERDVEAAHRLTGVHFSCPVLEWKYNQMMYASGIPADYAPGCCTVACPDCLWPVFMAD